MHKEVIVNRQVNEVLELDRLMKIKKISNLDITLVAGEGGLHNIVSWVHMVETLEASDFLYGGEIVFTTGIGLQRPNALMEMVKVTHERDAAGMIINTGPFIEKIPQDVIDYGNKNDYPIFVVPWKVHLAEIMRIMCYSITMEERKFYETSAAFKNAIKFPDQEELYVVPLSEQNFPSDWPYCVCVIEEVKSVENKTDEYDTKDIDKLIMNLTAYMQRHYKNFALFSYDSRIVVVMFDYTDENRKNFVRDLFNHAKAMNPGKSELIVGVGKVTRSIRCISKSYKEALSICSLRKENKLAEDSIYYDDLGLYKILIELSDTSVLQEFYDQMVKPLEEYDEANQTDISQVMWCYLKNSCSVKDTSEQLFMHRNTINYKIHRAEEILDADLSQMETRVKMTLAFLVRDFNS